jgi:hypothetical protein
MDKAGQSLPLSVIHEAGRKYCNCHMRTSLGHLGQAECPVINQLRLDFGAFTCNPLGCAFVRPSFKVRKQSEVMCVSTGQPTRCEYVKR